MKIVQEPTAAVVYAAIHNRVLLDALEVWGSVTVVVVDMGGGTLDVTVVQLTLKPADPGCKPILTLRVLALAGNLCLGGKNIRDGVFRLLREKFPQMHVVEAEAEAEAVVHTLSSKSEVTRQLSCGGTFAFTRAELCTASAEVLRELRQEVQRAVKNAAVAIDFMLPVGGPMRSRDMVLASAATAVKDMGNCASDLIVLEVSDDLVTTMVAMGACELCSLLCGVRRTPYDLEFLDVTSHTVSIGTQPHLVTGATAVHLVPAGSLVNVKYPTSAQLGLNLGAHYLENAFALRCGGDICFPVYKGSSMYSHANEFIGEIKVTITKELVEAYGKDGRIPKRHMKFVLQGSVTDRGQVEVQAGLLMPGFRIVPGCDPEFKLTIRDLFTMKKDGCLSEILAAAPALAAELSSSVAPQVTSEGCVAMGRRLLVVGGAVEQQAQRFIDMAELDDVDVDELSYVFDELRQLEASVSVHASTLAPLSHSGGGVYAATVQPPIRLQASQQHRRPGAQDERPSQRPRLTDTEVLVVSDSEDEGEDDEEGGEEGEEDDEDEDEDDDEVVKEVKGTVASKRAQLARMAAASRMGGAGDDDAKAGVAGDEDAKAGEAGGGGGEDAKAGEDAKDAKAGVAGEEAKDAKAGVAGEDAKVVEGGGEAGDDAKAGEDAKVVEGGKAGDAV